MTSSQTHRRTALNAAATAVAHGGSAVILLALTPLVVRSLGLELYGAWALINTCLLYTTVADFGIGSALTKFVAEYRERGELGIVRQLTTFGVLFYAAIACVLIPVAQLLAPSIAALIKLSPAAAPDALRLFHFFAWYLGFALMATVFNAVLIGLGRAGVSSMTNAAGQLCFVATTATLLLLHFGVTALMIGASVQLVVRLAAAFTIATRTLGASLFCNPLRIERPLIRKMFAVGGWVQLSSLFVLALYESDQIFIGLFVNASAIGVFDIGSKLARSVRVISYYFSIAAMPAISALEVAEGTRRAEMTFVSGARYVGIASFLTMGLLIATVPMIVGLWLGPDFPQAATVAIVVAVLGVTYIVDNVCAVAATVLRGLGANKLEVLYTAVGAGTNIAVSLLLGPHFGIIGVVAGTVSGAVVGALIFLTKFARSRSIDLGGDVALPLCELALSAIAGILAVTSIAYSVARSFDVGRAGLAAEFVVAVAVYVVIFMVTLRQSRFFKERDAELMRKILPARAFAALDRPIVRAIFG